MSSRPKRTAAKVATEKISAMFKPAKKVNRRVERLKKEMDDFFDPAYSTEFKAVKKVDAYTVLIEMHDDSLWSLSRSLNFFDPPNLTLLHTKTDGSINKVIEEFNSQWTSALSSSKWLLMIYNNIFGTPIICEKPTAAIVIDDTCMDDGCDDLLPANVRTSGSDADDELSMESLSISDEDIEMEEFYDSDEL